MVIYELTHLFFRDANELIYSPKGLGLFYSYESVKQAIQYFDTQPGFCDNQDAFSIRERNVLGCIIDDEVFESSIYLHSQNYEFEVEIELGLFGDEISARNKLAKYCTENTSLANAQGLIVEKILNKCIVERREWTEGFVSE